MKKILTFISAILIALSQIVCYASQNFKIKNLNPDYYVIEPVFDSLQIAEFEEGLINVQFNGKWGAIDKKGNTVIPFQYDNILNFDNGIAFVEINGKWGLVDKLGKVLINPCFDDISDYEGDFARVAIKGQGYGLIDRSGNFIIQPKYDNIDTFSDGVASFRQNNKYGIIDKIGKVIFEPQFDGVDRFSNGIAIYSKGGKDGIIDKNGNILVEPIYTSIHPFNKGFAITSLNNKYGLINNKGQIILEPQYEFTVHQSPKFSGPMVLNFNEGLEAVEIDGKWGFVDKTGKFVIAPQYINASNFLNGVARVSLTKGKTALIDKLGNILSEGAPDSCLENYNFGGVTVKYIDSTKKYVFFDKEGKRINDIQVDSIISTQSTYLKEGMITFKKDNKYGFLNTQNKVVINPVFDKYEEFQDGLAGVEINKKWGMIDKLGKFIVSPKYTWILPFKGDLKGFGYNHHWGYLNSKGKVVIEPRFDEVKEFGDGAATVKVGNRWRLIDTKGNFISSYSSQYGMELIQGISVTESNGKYGLIIKKNYCPDYKIKINSNFITMDVPPINDNGRILVPFRSIFEALQADVSWDAASNKVSAIKSSGESIDLKIGEKTALLNGKVIPLDVSSTIVDGRAFVPLRFISESFGAKVQYDSENRLVHISTN